MNSAAVIGRQLRQQQSASGRTSGPLVPPSPHRTARPRTPSHQPHPVQQQLPSPPAAATTSVYTIQSATQQNQQHHSKEQKEEQKKGLDKMTSCISFRCIWLCCKSLSGGVLLIAIGVGMTVFGFYADTFAVHEEYQEATNKTVKVMNEDLKYHIHNFSFVGPVFMGLGGMLIVAACVLIYDNESNSRVAPIKARRPSDGDTTLTEHLINPQRDAVVKSERLNGPMSPFLPNHATAPVPVPGRPNPVQDKGGGDMTTIAEVQVLQPGILPNGPSREKRPRLPLPVHTATSPPSESTTTATAPSTSTLSSPFPNSIASRTTNKKRRHFLSPLFDEFVPSPQDIQIQDPDGCTPDSSMSLEMDVYVTKCPKTVRVQLEPRYLASIESDGLSDSDTAESEFTTGGSSSILSGSSRIGGGVKGRYCSPCEIEEQDIPLLGRCSPPSSPEYPLEPLLKRDRSGLRRFPILRHPASLHHNTRMIFDGPSSEGGSR